MDDLEREDPTTGFSRTLSLNVVPGKMIDSTQEKTKGDSEPTRPQEILLTCYAIVVLTLSMACPWAFWFFWGRWAGLGGILASHVLYMALLAPRSGICLGIPWIFVFLNGIIVLLALGGAWLWSLVA